MSSTPNNGRRSGRRSESLAFQSAVLTASRGLGFFISAITPVVMVRVFDLDAFGVYKIVFLVASTAIVFCNLGFDASIFYFVPRAKGDGQNFIVQALFTLTALGVAGAGALLVGREFLAAQFGAPELVELLPVIALYVLLAIPATSNASPPIADKRSVLAAWIMATNELLRASSLVIAALWFGTVYAVAWAAVISGGLRAVVLLAYLVYRQAPDSDRVNWPDWKHQVQYAVPFGIAILFDQGLIRGHQFFVSGSVSPADFAIYAIGVFQIPVIGTLVSSVAEVVIVRAAPAYQAHKLDELRQLWTAALKPLAVMLIPIWILLELVAPELIRVLFGHDYGHSEPIFRVFLIAIVVHIILDHGILRATGDTRFLVWANATGFVTSLLGLFVLTRWDLMLGSVWAYILGLIVIRLLGLMKVASRLEMRLVDSLPWRTLFQAGLAAGGSAATAHIIMQFFESDWARLAIGSVIFMGVYGSMVWVFRLLPRQQITDLTRRLYGAKDSEPTDIAHV